jgi:nucleolin
LSLQPEKPTVAAKRPLATDKKNKQSSDESDDSSDESSDESDEEPPQKKPKPATKVSKKESSSDEEEDSEEESDKQAKTPKTKLAQNEDKTPAKNQSQSAGSKTIFVGNLSYSVDREQVKQFFEEAGEVVDVRLSTFEDGSMKGYGHVEFATAEAAQKALEFANHDLMGRPVRVDIAVERGAYTPGSGRDNSSFKKSAPRSGNTVFIKGFDTSSGEDQIRSALEEHFGSCGEIVRISIPKDYETGASKGMAYMDFKDPDSLNKAYELNGSDLGGYSLYVDEAKPRPDNNRDGGFSGGRRGSFSGRGGRSDRGRGGGRGRDGGRGRGFGGRGGRGDRGRGGRGTPYRQSAGTVSTGKKMTFGDD